MRILTDVGYGSMLDSADLFGAPSFHPLLEGREMDQLVQAFGESSTADFEPTDFVVSPKTMRESEWSLMLSRFRRTPFVRRNIESITDAHRAGREFTASLFLEWPFSSGTLNERAAWAHTSGYGRLSLAQVCDSLLKFPFAMPLTRGKKFYFLHDVGLSVGRLPLIITLSVSETGEMEIGVEQYGNPDKKVWNRAGGWVMRKQTW